MPNRLCLVSLAFLVCVSPLANRSIARADDPPAHGELLELVGADAGLCVEITDLSRQFPQFEHSELFERLEKLPFYAAWKQSREFRKLAEIQKVVENRTGQPLGQFTMDLFGQKVVFVVYPRESGRPAGVLLLRAVDGESLGRALTAWNRDDRVKLEVRTFSKVNYRKRTENNGKAVQGRPQFYFVKGPIFAVSDNEAAIQKLIKRSLKQENTPALRESENYRTAKSSLPVECWATLYFAPRAWKTGWEYEENQSKAEQFAVSLWNRCQTVAAGLHTRQGVAVDVVLHYDPQNLPERWQHLVEKTRGFPRFLDQVPARAFLVFAGKQDLAGIDQIITAEISEPNRRQWQTARQIGRGLLLGLDLFEDVLPKLRSNWGMYFVPRDPLVQDAVPVEGLLAIELPPIPKHENAIPLRKALENALSTGFNFLAATQNSKTPNRPALLKSASQAGGTVWWLESIGPYRPSYCLSQEYLVFASSPKIIVEFLSPAEPKLTANAVFRLWSHRQNPPEGQVVFISWQAIRAFLEKHQKFLLDQAVAFHGLPRKEAEKRLMRLEEMLEVLDAVYVGLQILPDQIRITAGGITAE